MTSLFDILPKDIVIEFLLYCDTKSLHKLEHIYALDDIVRGRLMDKIRQLLIEKYIGSNRIYIRDARIVNGCSCDICKEIMYCFSYIRMHAGYSSRPLSKQDSNSIRWMLHKETQEYKQEQKKKLEKVEKDGIYSFELYPEQYQPSGGYYTRYTVCHYCALYL